MRFTPIASLESLQLGAAPDGARSFSFVHPGLTPPGYVNVAPSALVFDLVSAFCGEDEFTINQTLVGWLEE